MAVITTVNCVSFSVVVLLIVGFFGGPLSSDGKLLPKEDRQVKQPPASSFSDKSDIVEGIQKLRKMLLARRQLQGKGSLEMGMERFREMVFEPPRNYSAFVLFYSERDKCESCENALEAWEYIAQAYLSIYADYEEWSEDKGPLFFVKVRITGGYRDMLELPMSYPSVYYFAPSSTPIENDFQAMDRKKTVNGRLDMVSMISWIQKIRPEFQFTVEKKETKIVTASNLYALTFIGMLGLIFLYRMGYWEPFYAAVKDMNYAYLINIMLLWLVSGQMFNHIRGTPLFGSRGMDLSTFIYPGSRYQYGAESLIVMILYGLIIYGFIEIIKAREEQLHLTPPPLANAVTSRNADADTPPPIPDPQSAVMSGLSCFYFGFLALQMIQNMKM